MSPVDNDRHDPLRRVLVTGSRRWANPTVVREALQQVWGNGGAVLVTGACQSGADRIAEMFWRRWGGRVERHPAQWELHGRRAGLMRNQAMVALGADVCVAFIRDNSPGASHTAQLAEAAGIPVYLHTHHTRGSATGPDATEDHNSPTRGTSPRHGPTPAKQAAPGRASSGRVRLDPGSTNPAPGPAPGSAVRSPSRRRATDVGAAAARPGEPDPHQQALTDARDAVDRLHHHQHRAGEEQQHAQRTAHRPDQYHTDHGAGRSGHQRREP